MWRFLEYAIAGVIIVGGGTGVMLLALLEYVIAGVIIVGGGIGVMLLTLWIAFIKALPFLIKLGAVALLAYFGLGLFGII